MEIYFLKILLNASLDFRDYSKSYQVPEKPVVHRQHYSLFEQENAVALDMVLCI